MKVTYAVKNIMTEAIVSMAHTQTLNDAMKAMVEKKIGSVVITRGGTAAGILTERDVLVQLQADIQRSRQPVGEIMSSPLVTIDAAAAIGEAADLMARRKIRRLLVTEKGEICGIVSERDLMRATLDVFNRLLYAMI